MHDHLMNQEVARLHRAEALRNSRRHRVEKETVEARAEFTLFARIANGLRALKPAPVARAH